MSPDSSRLSENLKTEDISNGPTYINYTAGITGAQPRCFLLTHSHIWAGLVRPAGEGHSSSCVAVDLVKTAKGGIIV